MERPYRRLSLLWVFGVATAFGIFSGLQAFNYVSLFDERKQPLHILLALNLTYWYAWAVLAPVMVWMARRFRFGRHTWRRAAVMHVGGVLACTGIHALLTTAARIVILDRLAGGRSCSGRSSSSSSSSISTGR
jgi:hypothetical protein